MSETHRYPHPRQVKWGGTHRFHDAAAVEAKHRISLKANGEKIRVRSETQTEKDLLQVTQEELVFESLEQLLDDMSEDPPSTIAEEMAAYDDGDDPTDKNVNLSLHLRSANCVHREHLVHPEVLLSWGELLDKFGHCFPSVATPHVQELTRWAIYQHCSHQLNDDRYHYWGTDTGYPAIFRASGTRQRRDMVHVSGTKGQHLAEIVCFVKARLEHTQPSKEFIGVLVRWLTPHVSSVMYDGSPTCPGSLCYTHNLWSWHRIREPRPSISGYQFGRLPDRQKTWLLPPSKRESLLSASYDVIELQTIGKYANVTKDFCTNGFLESVSWA